jgi:oxaloacetate decarboxylase (Na+ extruding) subunit alpha
MMQTIPPAHPLRRHDAARRPVEPVGFQYAHGNDAARRRPPRPRGLRSHRSDVVGVLQEMRARSQRRSLGARSAAPAANRNTPLRTIRSRSMLAFQMSPPAVTDLWLERLAANGISEVRTSDPSNTPSVLAAGRRQRPTEPGSRRFSTSSIRFRRSIRRIFRRARSRGRQTECRAYLLQRSRRFAHAGSDAPFGAVDFAGSRRTSRRVPYPLQYRLGRHLLPRSDQARHCFDQYGNSAARGRIFESVALQRRHERPRARLSNVVDEETLAVQEHFFAVAKQEKLPVGKPLEYDAFHPLHQVPGGMISNFRFQLANLGKLANCRRCSRKSPGCGPSSVIRSWSRPTRSSSASRRRSTSWSANATKRSPTKCCSTRSAFGATKKRAGSSQSQRSPVGKRESQGTGRVEGTGNVAQRVPPKIRFGGSGVSDDDALLKYFAGAEAVDAMRAGHQSADSISTTAPLLTLIEQIAKRKDSARVYIERPGFRICFERRHASA